MSASAPTPHTSTPSVQEHTNQQELQAATTAALAQQGQQADYAAATQAATHGTHLTPEAKAAEKTWRAQVRAHMKAQRQALRPEEVTALSQAVHQQVLSHPFLQQARRIASYMSFAGEIDTHALNELLKVHEHMVGLPVIVPEQKGIMEFYRYEGQESLVPNAFKILEPHKDPATYMAEASLEVVLVPLVAFNHHTGARIGMGGGFYDRLLKKIRPECLTIGLAYDFQYVEGINIQAWDMPLDEIITPTHHYRIQRKY